MKSCVSLKQRKRDTEVICTALSLLVQSITLTEQGDVIIRHTLPGYTEVVSKNGGDVSAPPDGNTKELQLLFHL